MYWRETCGGESKTRDGTEAEIICSSICKISCNINKTESAPSLKQHPVKKSAPVKMYQEKTDFSIREKHTIPGKDEKYRKTVASPKIDQNYEKEENNQFPLSYTSQKTKGIPYCTKYYV
uniref:Uncharacterized protein n=1 Tax=Micrurus lemniscatus lemniscatus TaxID=129467 RepID=A0A2D4JNL4_MICLE